MFVCLRRHLMLSLDWNGMTGSRADVFATVHVLGFTARRRHQHCRCEQTSRAPPHLQLERKPNFPANLNAFKHIVQPTFSSQRLTPFLSRIKSQPKSKLEASLEVGLTSGACLKVVLSM